MGLLKNQQKILMVTLLVVHSVGMRILEKMAFNIGQIIKSDKDIFVLTAGLKH